MFCHWWLLHSTKLISFIRRSRYYTLTYRNKNLRYYNKFYKSNSKLNLILFEENGWKNIYERQNDNFLFRLLKIVCVLIRQTVKSSSINEHKHSQFSIPIKKCLFTNVSRSIMRVFCFFDFISLVVHKRYKGNKFIGLQILKVKGCFRLG